MLNWQSTRLWELLQAHDGEEAREAVLCLEHCMPDIERVLKQGGTAPTDFTLHDAEHAFRVARRMGEVIPSDVLPLLSSYELALLLMSAYLHDIGMTPEQRKVTPHYLYLLTSDAGPLLERDIAEFQRWLDENADGLVPPMVRGQLTAADLRQAAFLTTHYCRYCHNDWSEEWIRRHLAPSNLGKYTSWLEDLVELCRSHHYGYEELRSHRFNPTIVGSPGVVVHLRYLAVALRVADILEFDPERTPSIILKHRDVSPGSLIYWWKDAEISMVQEDKKLVVVSRPVRALVHRAIETTIDDVERELEVARRLADETHFDTCPGLTRRLPHRWDLTAFVYRDISPRDSRYEYIDGAFRPDTAKVLDLLSGQELYGSPLVAIREVLQNAFDAVREQIAYERLLQPNPAKPELEADLANLHRVDVRVEVHDDGTWLICTDSGVGMTKRIIKDHVLVTGSGRRHDVLALERRCRAAGFLLGRTGQFGIGVLSYFMLADKLVIMTRRSQEAGDSESTGWRFETDGIGSFGELRRDDTVARGTSVRLRLRPAFILSGVAEWFTQAREYVNTVAVRIPCALTFSASLPECASLALPHGWVLTDAALTERVISQIRPTEYRSSDIPVELLPQARQNELQKEDRYWSQLAADVKRHLRWRVREGVLPDGTGNYRVHLPYFDLPGGPSLAFLRLGGNTGDVSVERIHKGYALIPKGFLVAGWKGIRAGLRLPHQRDVNWHHLTEFVGQSMVATEVDFLSSDVSSITVNRHEFTATDRVRETLGWLQLQGSALLGEFVSETKSSRFTYMNHRIAGIAPVSITKVNWLHVSQEGAGIDARWRPVEFPAISSLAFTYQRLPAVFWRGHRLNIVRGLQLLEDDDHYDGLAFVWNVMAPDRVMLLKSFRPQVAGLWLRSLRGGIAKRYGIASRFPPKWRNLCGAQFWHYSKMSQSACVWSLSHTLWKEMTDEGFEWCRTILKNTNDPVPQKEALLTDRGRASAWLALCLQRGSHELFRGLNERAPGFLTALWSMLFGSVSTELWHFVNDVSESRLRIITPASWTVLYDPGEITSRLGNPGEDWTILATWDEHRTRAH